MTGGVLADRWRRRTLNGRLYVAMLTAVLPLPFALTMLTTHDTTLAAVAYFPMSVCAALWSGPAVSTIQDLVLPRMRAIASAAYLLMVTFVGLALGPYAIGRLSVALGGLRPAMLCGLSRQRARIALRCAGRTASRARRIEQARPRPRRRRAEPVSAPMSPSEAQTHFADTLIARVRALGHPLCVGLDPHLDPIPPLFRRGSMTPRDPQTARAVEEFLLAVLDRVADKVAVVKPQIAFFEQLGWRGLQVLETVVARAREHGLLVLLDAKRGDIGSTAEGYARAYLAPGRRPCRSMRSRSIRTWDVTRSNPTSTRRATRTWRLRVGEDEQSGFRRLPGSRHRRRAAVREGRELAHRHRRSPHRPRNGLVVARPRRRRDLSRSKPRASAHSCRARSSSCPATARKGAALPTPSADSSADRNGLEGGVVSSSRGLSVSARGATPPRTHMGEGDGRCYRRGHSRPARGRVVTPIPAHMPKSHTLEDTLAALNRLRDDPTSDAALAQLRQVLNGKSSHATAKAAQIAGESEISALAPDLVAAFEQFMVNPVKSDPNCRAKAAIADALYRIGARRETVFLRGIRHRQMEPVYGGRVDTAIDLRAACALGLVRMNHPDALVELADLLADPESRVRAAAAQAIAYYGSDQGVPLLRLKVLSGDDDATVISECLAALLRLAPASSLPFAARLLDAPEPSISEAAALALGGSRLPEAFDVLRQWWDRIADVALRRTALLAIAMLRRDQPLDFLISLIKEANGPTAREAIAALAMYRHDDTVRQRVEECVDQRKDVDLRKAFAEAF